MVAKEPASLKALTRQFEICHKLAQAYSVLGDQTAALKELEYVTQLQRDYLDRAQRKKPDTPPRSGIKLPAKLIVSATKRDLDSVAA